jgi:phosphoglycerate dehydrogenase-like enzyme
MATTCFQPPRLPKGVDKHHIVVLEGVHAAMPTFDFPHRITVHQNTAPAQLRECIKDATIVINCVCPITPSDLDHAPNLQCVSVMAVGLGWLDKPAFAARGITVTNCAGGNVDAVSEHFLGLYCSLRKRVVQVHNSVTRTNEWREKGTLTKLWPSGPPRGARQEVLGIFGYGTLGKRIQQLCSAIGFREVLIAERKGSSTTRPGRVTFEECLKRSTVLAITLPHGPETIDLISTPELGKMQKDAILINVARGGIVNEAALATALRNGTIAGAATDVLETEPGGPGSSPLLPDTNKGEGEVPNLVVSSHIAWFTQSTIENYQRLLKDGVEGFVEGRHLRRDAEENEVVDSHVVVHQGRVWN